MILLAIRRALRSSVAVALLVTGAAIRLRYGGQPTVLVAQQLGAITPATPPTATPTLCPSATPEPLWVEPVVSPTGLLTQTLTVRIGNGEAVTVTAESGVFTATGSFNVYGNPAQLTLDLLADTAHHLDVWARVRRIEQWGCVYGGYMLHTARDRNGRPLLIQQRSAVRFCYLPMILR